MNELQIRISADIANLQSALNKAKASLKSFEESTEKESEKSNVGFRRKIGLIESLTNKSKALRDSLSKATNEKDVERYNQELEKTIQEMTRLNALGRTLGNASTGAAGGINKLAKSQGNANGVAIEFNRIIQDSPFGLMGVGNNIQQLTANFAQLRGQTTSAGAAIKASLSALISPVNLLVLGVSALTAGFTAYQMGAFDFLKSNEAAAKSLDELANEIDNAISRTSAESANINALRTVIEDETIARDKRFAAIDRLQKKYPEIFGNADREKLLNGELIQSYELLTKAIIQRAEASLAEETIPKLNKEKQVIDGQILSLKRKLELEKSILEATSKGAAPSGLSIATGSIAGTGQGFDAFAVQEQKVKDVQKQIDILNTKSKTLQINIDGFVQSIVSYQEEFVNLLEPINSGLDNVNNSLKEQETDLFNLVAVLDDYALKIQNALDLLTGEEKIDGDPLGISKSLAAIGPPVKEFAETYKEDVEKIEGLNESIIASFNALSNQIVNDLGIANNGLRAFLSTVISNAPKIISAIVKTAQANKDATDETVESAKKGALANGIFMATETGKTLGPIGLALLPVLIGGVLGLISGAFSKAGAGGGGGGVSGGGVPSGGTPQLFSNSQAKVPSPFNPDLAGFSSGFNAGGGKLTAEVSGDSLIFVLERAQEKRIRS